MKATIIGCGYVGKEVAQLWQSQGLTVTATTTSPERVPELVTVANRVCVLKGSDLEALHDCLADQHTLLVSIGPKRGASYEAAYLSTAQTLAQVLPHTQVQHLIYTSTYSVYGQHHGAWVTEASVALPATENAQVILTSEQIYLNLQSLSVCVLRLGGIYGPGRELAKIFGRAAGTTRPGDGSEISNWVYLDDIVRAIDFARQHQLVGLYNLVQDEILTLRELLEQVCQRHGLEAIHWDPTQLSARAYNARVSNQKLKAAGYQFQHPRFFDDENAQKTAPLLTPK